MTHTQVTRRLQAAITDAGGVRALARQWGVSAAYLSDAAHGKRGIGPAILQRLGVRLTERTIHKTYEAA